MADVEQFTEEQAQKLLEETMSGTTPAVVDTTPPEPALDTPAEPAAAEAPVEPDKSADTAAPEADKPKEGASADATDPYAWVGELPENLREKVITEINEKIQARHQFNSNKGRITAHQQKILELERLIANRSPASTTKPAPAGQPPTPESWKEVVKSDPELANAIEAHVKSEVNAAVGSLQSEVQELRKTAIDPLYADREQRYVSEQRHELERLVPNVNDVIASEQYKNWFSNHATPGIRDLATRSVNAQDAVVVLKQYADDMVRLGYFQQPAQIAAPAATADTSEADRVSAERERKLKASTVVGNPPIAPTAGASKTGPVSEADAEKLFLEAYNKMLKKT